MLEVHYGLGRHIYYFQDYKLIGFLKYNYLDWVQVFVTLAICKISICLFLLRISKFDKYRRVLWGMIAFLVLSHLPLTLLYILQCVPVYKVWYQQAPGTCFSMVTVEKIVIVQGGEFTPSPLAPHCSPTPHPCPNPARLLPPERIGLTLLSSLLDPY